MCFALDGCGPPTQAWIGEVGQDDHHAVRYAPLVPCMPTLPFHLKSKIDNGSLQQIEEEKLQISLAN
jgi:hypothetical protein